MVIKANQDDLTVARSTSRVESTESWIKSTKSIAVRTGTSGAEIVITTDFHAWGGFGIVAGLSMWGYRVISTIGKKITELTSTRGFAVELAAASLVLFSSKLGLPIPVSHALWEKSWE
ncbi:hypothetical protein MLD38_009404 [Melastoma candidum]|uniref:Uncharacterized protein n=1 Tax=Melastoma candidum TaxID=119954 RepID=A0ACB9RYX4_9MYRT|nr:hypothetical protein MLD38_009404 [Melastoma candidum]